MFTRVRNYVYSKRRTISTVAGVAAGVFILREYLVERLAEVRERIMQDLAAKENLRRRFEQNQEDCAFSVEALLPTFGKSIMAEMDVEQLFDALSKMRGRGSAAASDASGDSRGRQDDPPPPPVPSEVQSVMPTIPGATPTEEISQPDMSLSLSASASVPSGSERDMSASQETGASWVEQFSAHQAGSSASGRDDSPPFSENSAMTSSMLSGNGSEGEHSGVFVPSVQVESSDEASGSESRPPLPTKVSLWNEIKILTFTRTLTIIYTTSLLTLLSRIQLNILGRQKYLESLRSLEREQRSRAASEDPLTALFSAWMWGDEARIAADDEWEWEEGRVTPDTERRYLTFTWWLLNVGWKEVGERVRRAVEGVFEPISLKARLSKADVERLLLEARSRVEFEASDPLTRFSFLDALLPPTPADATFVISQNGFPSPSPSLDPTLAHLLGETRDLLSAPEVADVLRQCFDAATAACLAGMGMEEEGRLAALLPPVGRWSRDALFLSPNLFVARVNDVRELAGVAAIVWAAFEAAVER